MGNIIQYLPFMIPIAILELALMVSALVHLFRRKKTKNLNTAAWAVIIIVFEIIGPVLYFVVGKEDE